MLTLRFDKTFHRALTLRVAQYLQDSDAAIARRLEAIKPGEAAILPEDGALYEQALVMLVTEVLCNVTSALRAVFGPSGDERLAPLVAQAVAKAIQARGTMDETRKERAS